MRIGKGAFVGNWSNRLGIALLLAGTALAGCQKEAVLEGTRFPVSEPLSASEPVEGQPAPVPAVEGANFSAQPISLPAAVANADWAQRGGNAAHTGASGSLSAQPQRVWSLNIGAGNSRRNRITASPVVAGGKVFAMDSGTSVAAATLGGGLLWETSLVADFDRKSAVAGGGVAAAGGKVFATTGYGEVVALDASSGTVLWRQRMDAPIAGAPAVDGNTVYVVARDGTALALDAGNGKILWQIAGGRQNGGVQGPASAAIANGKVLMPFATGEVVTAEAADGTPSWRGAVVGKRFNLAAAGRGDITGDPVVSGGVVYVGSASGRTVAMNAETGERLWSAEEGALNAPLVVGGSVFVVNDVARLVRLDAATGAVIWATDMPYHLKEKPKKWKAIHAHFGPVLAGGRIVVASSDGLLRLFNPVDGALVATADIPGGAASAPVLAGGMLLVMGGNGQIHAFR